MDLLPPDIAKALPAIGESVDSAEAIARVKFFTPDSSWTWYAAEFDGDDIFWGLVDGLELEFGAFRLSELAEARGPWNLPIERDLAFTPQPLSELYEELAERHS